MGRPLDPAPGGGILRGEEDARQVSYLELFFDLVLVFALLAVAEVPPGEPHRARRRCPCVRVGHMDERGAMLPWLFQPTSRVGSR
ncbi:hypothetical protein [Micromonospora sp. NPDC050495]|uniref:hypothetical protein n=1 Tax=Micromonospora sp. NPDC050495 TaxID=3154936 RepID=UPI0033F17FA1